MSDNSAIHIFELSTSDTLATAIDKINQSFNNLVAHGGGPQGIQGNTVVGGFGKRGLGLYAAKEPVSGEIDSTGYLNAFTDANGNIVQNKSLLQDDDKIISNAGILYDYSNGSPVMVLDIVSSVTSQATTILDKSNYWTRLPIGAKTGVTGSQVVRLKNPDELGGSGSMVKSVVLGDDLVSLDTESSAVEKITGSAILNRLKTLNIIENNSILLLDKESESGATDWVIENTSNTDDPEDETRTILFALYSNNRSETDMAAGGNSNFYTYTDMLDIANKYKDTSMVSGLYQGMFINPGGEDQDASKSYFFINTANGYIAINGDVFKMSFKKKNEDINKVSTYIETKNLFSDDALAHRRTESVNGFCDPDDNDVIVIKDFDYITKNINFSVRNDGLYSLELEFNHTLTDAFWTDTFKKLYKELPTGVKATAVSFRFRLWGGPVEYEYYCPDCSKESTNEIKFTVPDCGDVGTLDRTDVFDNIYVSMDNVKDYYPFFTITVWGEIK